MSKNTWGTHVYRIGNEENLDVQNPDDSKSIELQKKHIEPWLAAVFQSEHLALLLGSGFTKAVAYQAGTSAADMACDYGGFPLDDKLKEAAQQAAVAMGRGEANIEDQIRAANALAQGLKILGDDRHTEVTTALDALLMEPEAHEVDLPSRTLKTEADVDAWLTESRVMLLNRVKKGPVIG